MVLRLEKPLNLHARCYTVSRQGQAPVGGRLALIPPNKRGSNPESAPLQRHGRKHEAVARRAGHGGRTHLVHGVAERGFGAQGRERHGDAPFCRPRGPGRRSARLDPRAGGPAALVQESPPDLPGPGARRWGPDRNESACLYDGSALAGLPVT